MAGSAKPCRKSPSPHSEMRLTNTICESKSLSGASLWIPKQNYGAHCAARWLYNCSWADALVMHFAPLRYQPSRKLPRPAQPKQTRSSGGAFYSCWTDVCNRGDCSHTVLLFLAVEVVDCTFGSQSSGPGHHI